MSTSVFVSGATGFIAQHIIKFLLTKGYNVVGSVRSAAKGDHVKKLFASDAFTYEIVSDIVAPGAFDQALKNHPEVTVFLHTASPVTFNVTDIEAELLKPAVEGTKNVLQAIKVYGPQIKNVVVTSSVVAMFDYFKLKDASFTVSEASWNPITWEQSKQNPFFGYFGSKKFAEKAVWDFIEQENPTYTVNFINPGYVFGPQAFDSEVKQELNSSSEIINNLLKLSPDSDVPEVVGPFIDVRDVAKAHLAAFENALSKERLLLYSEIFTAPRLIGILAENFDSLKGQLPVGKEAASNAEGSAFDNTNTKQLLAFPFIDLKTSVVDSVAQILKAKGKASHGQ
ncbi:hypothetical protein JCM33374_g3249 [Metschnikowia sp. JCM 33374]|nr:hypothetical protein JCM33374_g3249 [Metschnikowia sp. JCM 33374]